WRSESGTVELHYFPTWTSAVDSAGFFHLVVDSAKLTRGKPNQFAVRSLGAESKRWFALDRIPDVRAIENILVEALAKRNNSRR
ncbi:MAG: hypothetical protein QF805_22810, partial [Pirellulaceae bacterium]|nr:hypothetical protein [Pirellulaceae bacterium]